MRNFLLFACFATWTASTFAMEMPSLNGVFNREIYDQSTLSPQASAEEIIEALRENKRAQLLARVVAELEERSAALQNQDEIHSHKIFKSQLAAAIALIPTLFFAPTMTPVVMAGGHAFSQWYAGIGINTSVHEHLKHKITCYLSAIQGESIALLEEQYVVQKLQRPIAKDLATRIENVLLLARDPSALNFSAHDFVSDALRLPYRHKQFADPVKLAKSVDISEENRGDINEIIMHICRQSRLSGDDLTLRTCFIVFDDQSPKSDAYPERMARVLGLSCPRINVEDASGNALGSCCFVATPHKGDLCTSLVSAPDIVQNSLVLIDLNQLARQTKEPIAYVRKLLAKKQLKSNYFGCTIDLGRTNFVIHLNTIEDSFSDDFLALLDELPLIEVSNFSDETKKTMLAHYAKQHELFGNADLDNALDVISPHISRKKVKQLYAMLERMSTTPREDWSEILGLSALVHELSLRKAALEAACANARECLNKIESAIAKITSEQQKRCTSFKIIEIDSLAKIVSLDNGMRLNLASIKGDAQKELLEWREGEEVDFSVADQGCFYLTNKIRGNYLRFLTLVAPKEGNDLYETFVAHNGNVITTQFGSLTRHYHVSAWDNDYAKIWQKGDVVIVGINDNFLYSSCSTKRLVLINLNRQQTLSNFVRVNLLSK